MVHVKPTPTHLWIINQYALRSDQAGGTRHHDLAAGMVPEGVTTTIFSTSRHYLSRSGGGRRRQMTQLEGLPDATFVRLPTGDYRGNGVGRVLNMLAFSGRVLLAGWRPNRIGVRKPQVIMGSSPHLFGALAGLVLARRHSVPFILEVRDIWPRSLIDLMGMSHRHPLIVLLHWIEKFLYQKSADIVGVLPGVQMHVRRELDSSANVTWVPNGVNLEGRPPSVSPRGVHRELQCVYMGAHGVANALDVLLEAIELLESDPQFAHVRPLQFELYGEGVSKAELQEHAKSKSLGSVTFHGLVPKSAVHNILNKADVLLLPGRATSLYEGGISPNKLFDYFAAGRPVIIGLSTPMNPVAEANAGVCVEAGSARALAEGLAELAGLEEQQRQEMGARGRQYVEEHHDVRRLAQTLAEIVKKYGDVSGR